MTDLDNLIAIHGEDFSVNQVSSGAADSYGDLAPTWSDAATEKVWLQDPSAETLRIIESMAGKLDGKEYVAFLLSDSVVARGNVLSRDSDSVRYDVKNIFSEKLFDEVSHKVAVLRKSEDA